MIDQGELLAMCGNALFGERWQTPLARVLGVDDRLIRRWVAKDRDIPPRRWVEIETLMRGRAAGLARAVERLSATTTRSGASSRP